MLLVLVYINSVENITTPPPRFHNLTVICLLLITSVAAIWLATRQIYLRNAFVNIVVAYPFFIIGIWAQRYKQVLDKKFPLWTMIFIALLATVVVLVCAQYNGYVWVYENGYGNNYLLYLLGGLAGTGLLYVISQLLNEIHSDWVQTISRGSVVSLGLHVFIIRFVKLGTLLDYFSALCLTLIFIPIIKSCEHYVPWVMGMYRVKKIVE